jgi:hypothetical protein
MLESQILRAANVLILLSGCSQADDSVSQLTEAPELDRVQAAVVFDGPPQITSISGEYVTVELSLQNRSETEVCLIGLSGKQTFYHNSDEVSDGFRSITYIPRSAQLAPKDDVKVTIVAELYDMFVFGDGYIQDYGFRPKFRDVVQGTVEDSVVPLEIFDNTYGKDIQLDFVFDLVICNPRSLTFFVETLPTSKFQLSPPSND